MKSPQSLCPGTSLSPKLQRALQLLYEGYYYADEFGRDLWDFAVNLRSLWAVGVTDNDLRWLLLCGHIDHRIEHIWPEGSRRVFHRVRNLGFHQLSCFVLTKHGIDLAREILEENKSTKLSNGQLIAHSSVENRGRTNRPYWDNACHTLFVRGKALKHFKFEAPNQEAVLRAFQQHHWQRCVAVTLPQDPGVSLKARLHDTIKNLNRELRPHLRFRQEGSGSRVSWESNGA